jgi:hypothetical protein
MNGSPRTPSSAALNEPEGIHIQQSGLNLPPNPDRADPGYQEGTTWGRGEYRESER